MNRGDVDIQADEREGEGRQRGWGDRVARGVDRVYFKQGQ